jgi:autotransporter adhesin
MNKTYRSVWSEADQTWVAAPETAAARGKSARRLAVLATSAVGFAVSFAPTAGATTTTTTPAAPVPGTVGNGGLELCSGAKGFSWGASGGSQPVDCSADGKGTTDGLAFSLNNSADSKGGYGFNSSTAQVAGYQNGTLNIKGASIMVYGPTTFDSIVTMSNKKIVQLAPGLLSADSTEAVNGSQLYTTNQKLDKTADDVANIAVKYDSTARDEVTFGGKGSSKLVKLHNVAPGVLSATSADAVNGSQLYTTNQKLDKTTDDVANVQSQVADAVKYDSTAHDEVTLGGKGSTKLVKLHNVAAGVLSATSADAVNGSQLYATNQKLDKTVTDVTNVQTQVADAVKYDSTAHDEVTLGGKGSSKLVKLHNVAAGALSAASSDAVNGSQLYATNQNVSNLQGQVADAVIYDSSAHDEATLGGKGSSKLVKLHNVAAGALSAASSDAVNGSQLYATNQNVSNLQGQVAETVKYDSTAHDEVTFGGKGSTKLVKLHNVAAGALSAASSDAVNGSQLYATNQNVSNLQGQVADAVIYDSSAHDEATLGGKGSSKLVKLHNVAAGALSAASSDAVNGSQLYATNQNVSNLQGQVAETVKYDSTAHDEVTLGGKGSSKLVKLHNVAAGALSAASSDAVNGSQLYATNQKLDKTADDVTNVQTQVADAVKYDSTAHDEVTLGGKGSSKLVKLHNVAAGALSATSSDAVNGSQLYATNQKLDKTADDVTNVQTQVADAVKYDSTAHDEVTLGGKGSSKPVKLHNVAAGTLSATSSDAVNGSQLYATNQNVSNLQGQVADAVIYDSSAHDTLTLGGIDAKKPVALHNISAAELSPASADAVNGSQLYATNLNVSNLQGRVADAVVYDTSAHDTLTLGGIGAKKPAALHNVAAGDLSPTSTDATNGAQLYTVNQAVVNNTTAITDLTQNIYNGTIGIVQQDPATRNITVGKDTDGTIVSLTGTNGVRRLTGLAAGLGANEAVNVAQIQSAGFLFDASGNVRNKAVAYDVGSIAAGSPSITLATGHGNSPYWVNPLTHEGGFLPLGTIISNVADGILDTDAVNRGQVNQMIGEALLNGGSKTLAAHQLAAADTGSGGDASQAAVNAVQYDSSTHDTITLSNTNGENVTMTGLQNGALTDSSTDAVTGQQLFTTNQSIARLDQAIQNVAANGSTAVSANTTSGAAAAAGTQSVAVGGGAVSTGASSTAIGDSANASAENSVAIGANSIANRVNAVSVGQEGAERQVVNVAAGTSGTDAVNLNQMNNALAQQNNAFSQQISGLQNSINTVQKNAYAGVAAAMAMPNLTPSGPGRTVVAAGGGYYKGGSAAAVGVTYRSVNAHWLVNGSVAVTNNGDAGARAQIGYEF